MACASCLSPQRWLYWHACRSGNRPMQEEFISLQSERHGQIKGNFTYTQYNTGSCVSNHLDLLSLSQVWPKYSKQCDVPAPSHRTGLAWVLICSKCITFQQFVANVLHCSIAGYCFNYYCQILHFTSIYRQKCVFFSDKSI